MRITRCLWTHHKGRMIKRHWLVQGKRTPMNLFTEKSLLNRKKEIVDAMEVAYQPIWKKDKVKLEFPTPLPVKFDQTHPDWKDRVCYTYADNNVVPDGLPQAQLLTKTILVKNELPERIEALVKDPTEKVESLVKRTLLTSSIFDAHQEKLPKLKDPNRPAFNFPRVLGITDIRRIRNISQKWIHICESISGPKIAYNRSLVHNGLVSVPIEQDSDLLDFTLTMDFMVSSATSLTPILDDKSYGMNVDCPSIYPLHNTIGLVPKNIYKLNNLYPIDSKSPWMNVHTVFVHHDQRQVKNITKLPVTEPQILARSLLKSFTVAAACARQKFGTSVKDLPEPVTVQCIQSDGTLFHFSVFQLNTLNLDGTEGIKNFWWSMPRLRLFEKAQYEHGKPTLEGYNPEVFKRIFAFYSNN